MFAFSLLDWNQIWYIHNIDILKVGVMWCLRRDLENIFFLQAEVWTWHSSSHIALVVHNFITHIDYCIPGEILLKEILYQKYFLNFKASSSEHCSCARYFLDPCTPPIYNQSPWCSLIWECCSPVYIYSILSMPIVCLYMYVVNILLL